ncbi:MAG: hypothetical protein KF878_13970 [Planctomycetes bacterium]|nr:hypothetical protein [Planctomycetota bacterium]
MDAFDAVLALPDLTRRTFQTPGAGASSRPFTVRAQTPDGLEVKTSRGGTVTLRAEAFDGGLKALRDLGADDPEGWVRTSDDVLLAVLSSENRDHAVASYVLPLLEAAGLIDLDRRRPSRARARRVDSA